MCPEKYNFDYLRDKMNSSTALHKHETFLEIIKVQAFNLQKTKRKIQQKHSELSRQIASIDQTTNMS